MKSRPVRRRSVRCRSASDCIGFSPITYSAVSSRRSIASSMPERCQPRFAGTTQSQSASHLRRRSSFSTYWKPGSRSGSAPMSPPPWTLFWPRSGLRPLPHLPTWPVSSDEVDQGEDVVDRVVVLGDAERPADHRLVGGRVGVGQLADRGGGHARLALGVLEGVALDLGPVRLEVVGRPVDELRVREAGVDDLARRSRSRGRCRCRRRGRATRPPTRPSDVRRGSTAYSRAPLWTPRRRWWKKIGCVSRALLPQSTIRSVSSASRYELVPPPAPNTVARPATEGACQVRLQLSMLLLPRTCRENFWAAKLTSLVAFEQLKIPIGAFAPRWPCRPVRRGVPRRSGRAPRPRWPDGARRPSCRARGDGSGERTTSARFDASESGLVARPGGRRIECSPCKDRLRWRVVNGCGHVGRASSR